VIELTTFLDAVFIEADCTYMTDGFYEQLTCNSDSNLLTSVVFSHVQTLHKVPLAALIDNQRQQKGRHPYLIGDTLCHALTRSEAWYAVLHFTRVGLFTAQQMTMVVLPL
jgi:hypothetical protein